MHTSIQLIELAKQRLAAKHGLELPMSDYRLGKLLDIRQTTVSNWRIGRSHIGTEFAARFADACEMSPEYVYACIQRERADTPDEISLLERIAEAFKGTKAAAWLFAVTMAMGMIFAPAGNQASAASFDSTKVCIMRYMGLPTTDLLVAAEAPLDSTRSYACWLSIFGSLRSRNSAIQF